MGKFISENLFLFVAICVLFVVICIGLIVLILILKRKKKNKEIDKEISTTIIEIVNCMGGKQNIISAEAKGSRLNVVLSNHDLLKEDKIKELGVSSIIKMTTKTTLLVGSISEEIVNYINK
ncbi:MAG: hypothetical protein ACI4U5_04920 [Bacilli bacterium]